MRGLWTMWRREVGAFFLSPVAYVVLSFFLVIMGFSLWWTVGLLSKGLLQGTSQATMLNDLFSGFFFWLGNLIVVPLITMRARDGCGQACYFPTVLDPYSNHT